MVPKKIIQIIPAVGWYYAYPSLKDDSENDEVEMFLNPVAFFALHDDGVVYPYDVHSEVIEADLCIVHESEIEVEIRKHVQRLIGRFPRA